MGVRSPKLYSRLESIRADKTALASFAEYLIQTIADLTQTGRSLDNYCVLSSQYDGCDWFTIAQGTKEYCIGYADARNDRSIVACGTFICWPEDQYGDAVEGTIV